MTLFSVELSYSWPEYTNVVNDAKQVQFSKSENVAKRISYNQKNFHNIYHNREEKTNHNFYFRPT